MTPPLPTRRSMPSCWRGSSSGSADRTSRPCCRNASGNRWAPSRMPISSSTASATNPAAAAEHGAARLRPLRRDHAQRRPLQRPPDHPSRGGGGYPPRRRSGKFAKAGYATLPGWSYRNMWWVANDDHGAFEARGIHGGHLRRSQGADDDCALCLAPDRRQWRQRPGHAAGLPRAGTRTDEAAVKWRQETDAAARRCPILSIPLKGNEYVADLPTHRAGFPTDRRGDAGQLPPRDRAGAELADGGAGAQPLSVAGSVHARAHERASPMRCRSRSAK